MTGGNAVVRMLEEYGVSHVFGLPGDTSVALYDALRQSKSITHILTRDERASAYMADGYAKVTNRPGVCEGPSGGGALYILPGVSEADLSRVPMIVLTTDIGLASDGRSSLTELDQQALFKGITRYTARVVLPEKIPEFFRKAFRLACGSRQGAGHLSLPEDILSGRINREKMESSLYGDKHSSIFPAARPRTSAEKVQEALALMETSERPILLAGGGVLFSQAWAEIEKIAETGNIPVVTSINGKGSIREDHPLALGVCGANGGKLATNQAVQQADLVIAVGTRLNSTVTAGKDLLAHKPKMIRLDLDGEQVGSNYPAEVGLEGDAKIILSDLLAGGKQQYFGAAAARGKWAQACREAVDREVTSLQSKFSSDMFPVKPHRFVKDLEKALPPETLVVCDAGTPTPYISAYYPVKQGGRTTIFGRGHGSLGYGLPAAIGASVGRPEVPVVALFGDGSMDMNIGEMETIARLNLPLTLILLRNSCFGWIKMLQKLYYSENYFGVDFKGDVNYVDIARSYGLRAYKVQSAAELSETLRQAVNGPGPAFVDVQVESMINDTPPVCIWQQDEQIPPEKRMRQSY